MQQDRCQGCSPRHPRSAARGCGVSAAQADAQPQRPHHPRTHRSGTSPIRSRAFSSRGGPTSRATTPRWRWTRRHRGSSPNPSRLRRRMSSKCCPWVHRIPQLLRRKPEQVLADVGYWSEANAQALAHMGVDPFIATHRRHPPAQTQGSPGPRARQTAPAEAAPSAGAPPTRGARCSPSRSSARSNTPAASGSFCVAVSSGYRNRAMICTVHRLLKPHRMAASAGAPGDPLTAERGYRAPTPCRVPLARDPGSSVPLDTFTTHYSDGLLL